MTNTWYIDNYVATDSIVKCQLYFKLTDIMTNCKCKTVCKILV